MEDIKIAMGMKFFLVSGDSRNKSKNGEYQVTKVGRKFFYVAPIDNLKREFKFKIDKNPHYNYFAKEVVNFGTGDYLYLNEKVYQEELEWKNIVKDFEYLNLSKEDKEKIAQICRPHLQK